MFYGHSINRALKSFCNILLAVSVLTLTGAPMCMAENAIKAPAKTTQVAAAKVNINTATAEQIANGLKGIGLKKAEAIITYRKNHGGFKKVEQLLEVKGIGEGTLKMNKGKIAL